MPSYVLVVSDTYIYIFICVVCLLFSSELVDRILIYFPPTACIYLLSTLDGYKLLAESVIRGFVKERGGQVYIDELRPLYERELWLD